MSEEEMTDEFVVGVRQTVRMMEQGRLSAIMIADDADAFVTKSVEQAALKSGVEVIRVPSKRQLGMRCGIDIGAAVAGFVISGRA